MNQELKLALQEAVKSLEWAAYVIKDIPPNSHFMQTITEAKLLLYKLNESE
jgi:hypothetical protein